MKLCYFNDYRLGVVKGDQVVDVTDAVKDIPHLHQADLIIGLIKRWDSYKAKVEKAQAEGKGVALSSMRLRAPVPRPGNIDCMAVNYMEDGTLKEKPQINAFHKASNAIIGNGDTMVLPDAPATVFEGEADSPVRTLGAFVVGNQARSSLTGVRGHQLGAQVELTPAGALALFGDVADLNDAVIPLDEALGTRGTELLERTMLAARNRGIKQLHITCLSENQRMQQLARKFDAELRVDDDAVVGEVEAPYPTPMSLMREMIADGTGLATAMLDAQQRMLKRT